MSMRVDIILPPKKLPPIDAWDMLRKSHPALLHPSKEVDLFGTKYLVSQLLEGLQKRQSPYFVVEFPEGQIDYVLIANSYLNQLLIEKCISSLDDAWSWIQPFAETGDLISALVWDMEYEYWQNAESLIHYKVAGRPFAHLPMKSNGAPPPVEETIIDISRNPGRRIFQDGYIESVGAVMWLGERFWQITGASKKNVIAQQWLKCDELPSKVLRLQAMDHPFTTAEGIEGKLQRDLRSLLFPTADKF